MKKKLVLMTSALMTIGLLAGCGNKHTHEWGDVSYTWAEDNSTCTATRVCKDDESHVDTETVIPTYAVVEEAKCEEDGQGRYTADFTSEAFVDQTKDITLEAIGHDLTAHDSHAETCTEAGNCAYWSCERCGKFFSDEEGKDEIENNGWIIPAHAHTLIHNSATAASCYVPGNIEYWTCDECHQYFSDEAGTHVISNEDVIVPAHHTLTHHAKDPESCTEPGIIEYWHCEVCGNDFYDEAGTREVEGEDDLIIPAHHVLTHHAAKDNSCEEDGNTEYYTCDVCGKYFLDEAATSEVEASTVIVPAIGHHTLEHHDAVDPKCEEDGNVEYYHCTVCGKNFSDAEGTTVLSDVSAPAIGHNYGDPSYAWSSDHKTCTAYRTCLNNPEHIDSEVANSKYEEIVSGDSVTLRYTASFTRDLFESQSCDLLTLTLNGNAYAVKAGSTSITGDIVIPSVINNKPVTTISADAFNNIRTITSVQIPNTVTEIQSNAFKKCHGLTSISIPASVTTLGIEAFRSCMNATSLTFEANSKLTAIPDGAFKGDNNIKSIVIPKSVTSIGSEAFASVRATSITFEEGSQLKSFAYRAFSNCSAVTEISLPEGVTSIGENAFNSCVNMVSCVIPSTVTSIEMFAFSDCPKLSTIRFNGTIAQWNSITKGVSWNFNVPATQVTCSDGVVNL